MMLLFAGLEFWLIFWFLELVVRAELGVFDGLDVPVSWEVVSVVNSAVLMVRAVVGAVLMHAEDDHAGIKMHAVLASVVRAVRGVERGSTGAERAAADAWSM